MPRVASGIPRSVGAIVLVTVLVVLGTVASYFVLRRNLRCSDPHQGAPIACNHLASSPDDQLPAD